MTRLVDADKLVWSIPPEEHIARCIVANAPTVDAVPVVHGRWIYGEDFVAMCDGYRCDKCGYFVPWDYTHKSISFIEEYKYCPNCGSRNRSEE